MLIGTFNTIKEAQHCYNNYTFVTGQEAEIIHRIPSDNDKYEVWSKDATTIKCDGSDCLRCKQCIASMQLQQLKTEMIQNNQLYSERIDALNEINNQLKAKLEELNNCDKTLIYIKARSNFEKLKKIKEISKGCCNNCDYAEKNNPDCECTNSKLNTIFEIIESEE